MMKQKMKWCGIFATLVILVVCLISVTACSNDDEATLADISDESVECFRTTLEHIADSILLTEPVQSRGSSFKRFWKAVKDDYIGQNPDNNATILSIGSSINSWHRQKDEEKKELEQIKPGSEEQEVVEPDLAPANRRMLMLKIDTLMNEYHHVENNFGALHNAVVLKSIVQGSFAATEIEDIVTNTIELLASSGVNTTNFSPSEEIVAQIDEYFNNPLRKDVLRFFEEKAKNDRQNYQIYNCMYIYYNNVENFGTLKSIRDYTLRAQMAVDDLDIDEKSKKYLKNSFSIVPASLSLWMEVDRLGL